MHRLLIPLVVLALPPAATAQSLGTIAGTITDASNGQPLVMTADHTVSVVFHNAAGAVVAERTLASDSSGSYTVNLAPGTYFVRTSSRGGYSDELHNDIACVAADCPITSGTPVNVTAGGTATVNFALSPGARISGTVRRASDNSVLESIEVTLFTAAGSEVDHAFTNASGTYSLPRAVPAGTYFVRTSSFVRSVTNAGRDFIDEMQDGTQCPLIGNRNVCAPTTGAPIVLTGGEARVLNFSLDPDGRITGRLSAASGSANFFGQTVSAWLNGVRIAQGAAAADDTYAIAGLPTGVYQVRTEGGPLVEEWYGGVCVGCPGTPAAVPVSAGATTPGIDITLDTGGSISGTLVVPVLPFTGWVTMPRVEAYNAAGIFVKASGQPIPITGSFGSYVPAVAAGGSFAWRIDALPPGTYYLRTSNPNIPGIVIHVPSPSSGWYVDEVYGDIPCVTVDCDPRRGTPVTVSAGAETSGIHFALAYGATISGEVRAAAPFFIDFPHVHVYDHRGVEVFPAKVDEIPPFVTGPPSDPSFYSVRGLPAGTYYLKMDRTSDGRFGGELYNEKPCEGCDVTSGTPVVVAAGESKPDIDFVGLPTGFAMSGTVRASTTDPLSTIRIEIFDRGGALAASTNTLADGTWRIGGLQPGTYYARTSNTRGFVDEIFDNVGCAGCSPTAGSPIVVSTADVANVDFTLQSGVRVSGVITTPVGTARAGVPVSFMPPFGAEQARAISSATGEYSVTLPAGEYRARTWPVHGLITELYDDIACLNAVCHPAVGTPIVVNSAPVTGIDFALAECTPPAIAPLRLANAVAGIAYRQVLTAAGGLTPIVFGLPSGALPPGLTLNTTTGVLSGTPTLPGRYAFTLSATDVNGCAGTRDYVLDIPACGFNLTPTTVMLRARGEPFLVTVSDACGTWTATTTDPWITINSVSASSVVFTTAPYTGAAPRVGTITVGPRVITVYQNGVQISPPFGSFDVPMNGAHVSGSIAVSGWALDDLGISRVQVYRDPVAGESGEIFLGEATIVEGARPDVEAVFPDNPQRRRAGWGFLVLTNMLPNNGNGVFRIFAYAQDSDGMRTLLGSAFIFAENAAATAPFGAIDTPAQGATILGSAYVNWGWALTPPPKEIAMDGSTIRVLIDGASVGTVDQYNLFRSDVSGLFPGLKNSTGPVGFKVFDTTALSEGLHTIAWIATDDAMQATGIGSRYFNVSNSAWRSTSTSGFATEHSLVPPHVLGIDGGRQPEGVAVDAPAQDAHEIHARELERIELDLNLVARDAAAIGCDVTFDGYLAVGTELRDVPVGSSLDRRGVFLWQPGAGFRGTYDLIFIRTACDGARVRIPVSVTIGQ